MSEVQTRNILMVNLPFSGHTNPTLELARTLVAMGHRVCYIHAPDWKRKIEQTGAEFIPYDGYPTTLSPTKKEMKSWSAAYQTVRRIGKGFDCLVYEMLFFPGKALADELEIPSFRLFSTFTLNAKVLQEFGQTGGWYMTAIFRFPLLCKGISKQLQQKFGLRYGDLVRELTDNAPPLNFTYTIRAFQIYAGEFDAAHYKYVGPSIGQRVEQAFDFSPMHHPIVYISLGTLLNTSVPFFRKCIEAFQDAPLSVILSLGNEIQPEQLGALPDNVFAYPVVPQLKVLQKAALFITHGGMNSVNEAIYYGVPMLAIPVGNDQPRVAQQIEALHLGKYIRQEGLTPAILRQAAGEILREPAYQTTLARFKEMAQAAGGNREIADTILESLNHAVAKA